MTGALVYTPGFRHPPEERRRLAFLFGDYLLAGELQVPKGARLSDFLSQAKPFQTLLEANLYALTPDNKKSP
jgi:hypothetical protein